MPDKNSSLPSADEILHFWFGDAPTATEIAAEKSALWWGKNADTDHEITQRFATVSDAAAAVMHVNDAQDVHINDTDTVHINDGTNIATWRESPRGILALIICTDQFPRNIHRDTPRAFAHDAVALAYAKQCESAGLAARLTPIERVFAYLPFEHSESLADQQHSVALYEAIAKSATPAETGLFETYLNFAKQHHDIIKKFQRFPHRNKILGRKSTPEEKEFLQQPNSSF